MPCQLEPFLIRREKAWNENKWEWEGREEGGHPAVVYSNFISCRTLLLVFVKHISTFIPFWNKYNAFFSDPVYGTSINIVLRPPLSPYKKAAPYLGVTVKVIYLWSYLREAACVIVMTANISIEDYWSMNKINWTELLHQIMTHWNTLQASGKKITSPMSISAKGRVQKFMLGKLVDFSIELVSPLRKMVLCE